MFHPAGGVWIFLALFLVSVICRLSVLFCLCSLALETALFQWGGGCCRGSRLPYVVCSENLLPREGDIKRWPLTANRLRPATGGRDKQPPGRGGSIATGTDVAGLCFLSSFFVVAAPWKAALCSSSRPLFFEIAYRQG